MEKILRPDFCFALLFYKKKKGLHIMQVDGALYGHFL